MKDFFPFPYGATTLSALIMDSILMMRRDTLVLLDRILCSEMGLVTSQSLESHLAERIGFSLIRLAHFWHGIVIIGDNW